jgi:NAD(P)-dependent dehydrogenase (short-subunit alcohol dehydrogenase family)
MSETSKVWFVTGATRGIGAEIVRAALAAGHRVVATGRDVAPIEKRFGASDRLLALSLDVTDEARSQEAVRRAVERFGRVDVLVNNAGYGQLGVFEEVDPARVETQFSTNVIGLFHVTRAVLPVMRAQRSGRILNVSSIGGLVGFVGASVYCASKFAVEGFSESLAMEVAPFGIQVSIIEPGYFRTDFLESTSIRYGDRAIEEYAEVNAATRAYYQDRNGLQEGDPVKLAAALLRVAEAETLPMRFLVGADAVGLAERKVESLARDIETWRSVSVATGFDA